MLQRATLNWSFKIPLTTKDEKFICCLVWKCMEVNVIVRYEFNGVDFALSF